MDPEKENKELESHELTSDDLKLILKQIIANARDAREEADKDTSNEFNRGRQFAYWEVLDTIDTELFKKDQTPRRFGLDFDIDMEIAGRLMRDYFAP